MGLGPPVCVKCNLMARMRPLVHSNRWYCAGCGDINFKGLWELTKETQNTIEDNENFLSCIIQTLNEIEKEKL